ncbi:hypothetical protein HUU42_09585 [bacterium]|nr:hypothetical protein [bacterium]
MDNSNFTSIQKTKSSLTRKEFLWSLTGLVGSFALTRLLAACSGKHGVDYEDIIRPDGGPFISLADYELVDRSSAAYVRFKSWVDNAVAGSAGYGYSAGDSLIMYHLSGDLKYLTHAIEMVDKHVATAEKAIGDKKRPPITDDSYLEVGPYIEDLALVYDYGFEHLTKAQRSRWSAYAEQAVWNIWNYNDAEWGGRSFPWSGWSVNNPGNNYHYSFLKATMNWALSSQNEEWKSFLKTEKFPPLVDYYKKLPGGGSREGTGYGTALQNLFENYRIWKASTDEDLANMNTHSRNSIDYWIHATVPTLDKFAPFGDQSRSSQPDLFDYHEHIMRELVILHRGTPEARRGAWWIENNSVNKMSQGFMSRYDLLDIYDEPSVPTDLIYYAEGVGHFFARNSWATDALWMAFAAGPYEESHAHQDQGSFTLYKGDWLAVTQNIWSHSGIHQETDIQNIIRFVRNGTTIEQTPTSSVRSTMVYSVQNGSVTVNADLSNAYSRDRSDVQSWKRDLIFENNLLRVHDNVTTGAGVQAIWQIQVPVNPIVQNDGKIVAGNLTIEPVIPSKPNVKIVAMTGDYSKGYRIELSSTVGNEFTVNLMSK